MKKERQEGKITRKKEEEEQRCEAGMEKRRGGSNMGYIFSKGVTRHLFTCPL